MWDVFISHASQDKATFVDGLAAALQSAGLKVWYDSATLTLGDSLRRKIDEGLAQSRFGVVVLSKYFFAKNWPQKELDGLAAREEMGRKVILPIWHGITAQVVAQHSPTLADRVAISTDQGLDAVVREILEAVGAPPVPGEIVTFHQPVERPFPLTPDVAAVFSDGSSFASQLFQIVQESGYPTPRITSGSLPFTRAAWDQQFADASLIVLARGEHFQGGGDPEFYRMAHAFIAEGGFVFATPWVSWETYSIPIVRDFLPFDHPGGGYTENAPLSIVWQGSEYPIRASFEHLANPRPRAQAFLSATNGVAIFGVREHGQGCCVYLNVCQHSCAGPMPSPLDAAFLRDLVRQTIADMRTEVRNRRARRRHELPRGPDDPPFLPSWVSDAVRP